MRPILTNNAMTTNNVPAGQDAGMGGKVSCDERENERGRDVMAKIGLDCGGKERPLVAGKGEGAGG